MKVLMLDSAHPRLKAGLEEMGFRVSEDYRHTADQLRDLDTYGGLIIRSRLAVNRKLLQSMPQLRFIGRVGAGLENIDLDYCIKRGIQVLNAPEGNRNAVGEQALAMLLMLFNNLGRADREVRAGHWRRAENRGYELAGKTVGIIGYGNTGAALARRLRGFDCRILAYDKYKKAYADPWTEECDLQTLQAEAEVISLHVPQSEETFHLVDEDFIAAVKHDFYLINTARGKSVDTRALVDAMQSGKIKGACLDVLEYEKSSFENLFAQPLPAELNYLLKSEKTVLSPHIAGWTHESHHRMAEALLEKIASLNLNHGA